jgi:hypothetical protein
MDQRKDDPISVLLLFGTNFSFSFFFQSAFSQLIMLAQKSLWSKKTTAKCGYSSGASLILVTLIPFSLKSFVIIAA